MGRNEATIQTGRGKTLFISFQMRWALIYTHHQISYYDLLSDFPFKSDEGPLRQMERAELISIVTKNGSPPHC